MRHTWTRPISYACALVLSASLVSGCGSSDDDQTTVADAPQSTTAAEPAEGEAVDGSVYLRPVLVCQAVVPTGASTTSDVGTTTSTPADTMTAEVVSNLDGTEVCQLGPAGGTGEVFEPDTAEARVINGSWGVTVDLRDGEAGEGVWNALAAECFAGAETCPSQRLAIQLDGKIVTAPTVHAPTFSGSVEITGSFTEDEAKGLAERLNGAR